ncbi:MAG: hypothetical protein GX652_05285 [Burkholderiaceae bacterium]|nr:hypothetical protein [Burkholderiaceae bacterium]
MKPTNVALEWLGGISGAVGDDFGPSSGASQMQPSVESSLVGTRVLPRAFVGSQAAYEQICAYGRAMGWSDKPFDFVVQQWLQSRPAPSQVALCDPLPVGR